MVRSTAQPAAMQRGWVGVEWEIVYVMTKMAGVCIPHVRANADGGLFCSCFVVCVTELKSAVSCLQFLQSKATCLTFCAVDDEVALLVPRGDRISDPVPVRVLSQHRGNQRVGSRVLRDERPISDETRPNTGDIY